VAQSESASYDTAELRRLLALHFSLDELRSLCQDLGLDYEALRGDTTDSKSLALIGYLERRNHLAELVAAAQRERPQVAWETAAAGTRPAQAAPPAFAAQPAKTPPPQTDIDGVIQIGNPIIRAWRNASTRISRVLQIGGGRIEVGGDPGSPEEPPRK
jgi:hypothetical protein